MPHPFPVPDAYRDQDLSPARQAWITRLPATAESLARRWGLVADGSPMFGFSGSSGRCVTREAGGWC